MNASSQPNLGLNTSNSDQSFILSKGASSLSGTHKQTSHNSVNVQLKCEIYGMKEDDFTIDDLEGCRI